MHLATGFCDAQNISVESDTTFYWPETEGGKIATIACPSSQAISVSRSCGIGGTWSEFDARSCSGISGQLSDLVDLFSNVRQCMKSWVAKVGNKKSSISHVQLTTEIYDTAVSRLSQVINTTETNMDQQSSQVLNTVANYTAEVAEFVENSNVIINNTVSCINLGLRQ